VNYVVYIHTVKLIVAEPVNKSPEFCEIPCRITLFSKTSGCILFSASVQTSTLSLRSILILFYLHLGLPSGYLQFFRPKHCIAYIPLRSSPLHATWPDNRIILYLIVVIIYALKCEPTACRKALKWSYDYVQGVSKMLGQSLRVLHIEVNKKVYINIRRGASAFFINWKITFNNKYINCVIFYLELT
jgi:hypothetical protein